MSQDSPVHWRMLVLVPIWSIQLFFLAPYTIILALLIGITQDPPDIKGKDSTRAGLQPWNIVELAIASTSLVLTCVEIIMQIQRNLHPSFYLGSNIAKIVMWMVCIVLGIVELLHGEWVKMAGFNRYFIYVTMGATILVYIPTIGSLVYGVIIYRRYRERVKKLMDRYI